MASPMILADFRRVVEPILNKVFDGVYDQRKDEYKQIFSVEDGIPRSYHEEPVFYGLGAAPEWPEGEAISYRNGGVLFVQRATYKIYGMAFGLSQQLIEDGDHVRMGKVFSEHAAQGLMETKETLCANILNRAFTSGYNGGDGVVLCSASHPISGGTYSNLLATSAALSQTSLEQMLIQIRNAKDNDGKRIRLDSKNLVVSPDNMLQAEVITKSVQRTGTTNNDLNPVKSMGLVGDVAVMSRLTSSTAWFVNTDAKRGLKVFMRSPVSKGTEGDFNTGAMRYKIQERYAPTWVDPHCIYGTPGV